MVERINGLAIGPEALLASNKSELAINSIEQWHQAKARGKLTAFLTCCDARVEGVSILGTPTIASIRSIAAAGSRAPFKYLLNHNGVSQIVIAGHFDGETLAPEIAPKGCGGLMAKTEDPCHLGVVGEYVESQIETPDVVHQAFLSAEHTSKHTTKPVLAVVVDHRTGVIYPIAQFSTTPSGNRQTISLVSLDQFDCPQVLYREGRIPQLVEDDLLPEFRQLINMNRTQVAKLHRKHPEFSETQRVQNPQLVILSTSPIPAAVRYPEITGRPNTGFAVRLAFEKNNGNLYLREDNLTEAMMQIAYPISHALIAASGASFADTANLLIETPSIDLSRQVAQRVMEMDLVSDWQKHRGGKIMITQIASGSTIAIDNIK